MDRYRSSNSSSSSARTLAAQIKGKLKQQQNLDKYEDYDDGYSSSESNNSQQQDEDEEGEDCELNPRHFNISKYLPPANPLIPKVQLPDFNKNKRFDFPEPCDRVLELQQYIAQSQSKDNDQKIEEQIKKQDNPQQSLEIVFKYDSQQQQQGTKFQSLLEYHRLHKDQLVYQKHVDCNLSEPTQINGVVYFATHIAHLQKVINPLKQNHKVPNNQMLPNKNNDIQFSSNFESGNLFCAYKINENEYDLILSNDINTKGNTQWFFFSVSNAKPGTVLKLNIMNLNKPRSLFNEGLCPAVYSMKQNEIDQTEWIRDGFNVSYNKGDILRDGGRGKVHYSLQFSYYVKYGGDTVYFAHSYPYTYSDLKIYINSLMKDTNKHSILSVKRLCKTLAGNHCEQLTITSSSINRRNERKGIVLFARQHPGETGGSYMIQGCIDFLVGDTQEAQYLRENCVFKIIPMVNPDGVIHGNYRCSLAGCDLNRRWKKPRKKLHPTVHALCEMVKTFKRERDIALVVDLHGHSRKMNTFFYGCSYREDPIKAKIFPFMMSKKTDAISFKDCRFGVQQSKEKTARISLWKELRVPSVYTLEASFFGKQSNDVKSHYSIQDLLDIGKNLMLNLRDYLWEEEEVGKSGVRSELTLKKENLIKEIQERDNQSDKDGSDGSDSDPSEDELPDEQVVKFMPKTLLTKRQRLLMQQEEERREKEVKNKQLLQRKQDQQQQQNDVSKRTPNIGRLLQSYKRIDKKQDIKPAKPSLTKVDAAVQTDASFIMEMKALKQQKIALQMEQQQQHNNNLSQSNLIPQGNSITRQESFPLQQMLLNQQQVSLQQQQQKNQQQSLKHQQFLKQYNQLQSMNQQSQQKPQTSIPSSKDNSLLSLRQTSMKKELSSNQRRIQIASQNQSPLSPNPFQRVQEAFDQTKSYNLRTVSDPPFGSNKSNKIITHGQFFKEPAVIIPKYQIDPHQEEQIKPRTMQNSVNLTGKNQIYKNSNTISFEGTPDQTSKQKIDLSSNRQFNTGQSSSFLRNINRRNLTASNPASFMNNPNNSQLNNNNNTSTSKLALKLFYQTGEISPKIDHNVLNKQKLLFNHTTSNFQCNKIQFLSQNSNVKNSNNNTSINKKQDIKEGNPR